MVKAVFLERHLDAFQAQIILRIFYIKTDHKCRHTYNEVCRRLFFDPQNCIRISNQ